MVGAASALADKYYVALGARCADLTDKDTIMTSKTHLSTGPGRGFPQTGPWVSYYGRADDLDLGRLADRFRIINIDADPGAGNFTAAQIDQLKAGGRNRVISYLNVGAVERSRTYWATVPEGFVAPRDNVKAQLGPYPGYPDEVWMNVGDPDWQRLVVAYLAPRLTAQGVDGFYFDNLEIVEHAAGSGQQPICDAQCAQGGLDIVAALRAAYLSLLFVMQNATGRPHPAGHHQRWCLRAAARRGGPRGSVHCR